MLSLLRTYGRNDAHVFLGCATATVLTGGDYLHKTHAATLVDLGTLSGRLGIKLINLNLLVWVVGC